MCSYYVKGINVMDGLYLLLFGAFMYLLLIALPSLMEKRGEAH